MSTLFLRVSAAGPIRAGRAARRILLDGFEDEMVFVAETPARS